MKIITKEQAVSYAQRKHAPGTAGVYVLVDPRTLVPRYVGSTRHAEHRLYSHMAGPGKRTPKQRWLAELKAAGLWPELWVVEEGDFGPRQSARRHEAERRWIEICQELFGGGDMNTALTPLGHANSKDSYGKKMRAELEMLRARVAQLERELARVRAQQRVAVGATRATRPVFGGCFGGAASAKTKHGSLGAVQHVQHGLQGA